MELAAAKMIGAGLAAIALAGVGVGMGTIFGNYLSAAIRNPSAAQKQFPTFESYYNDLGTKAGGGGVKFLGFE